MIYTEVPDYMRVDIDLFQTELNYFHENLPPQEQTKLKQFTSSSLCGTYYIDIYKPGAPGLWNMHLNLVDKEPTVNKKRYSSKYMATAIDNTLYEYESCYNFFEQTIQSIKYNKKINSLTLLYFKPYAVLPCHVHGIKEYVAHTLLNNTGNGWMKVHSENSQIQINKRGETFMHETHLPHGGRATESELWILSVTTNYFKQ